MSKSRPRHPKKVDGRKNNRPPPEKTWKPGQSGNPAGRPRGAKSTGTFVIEIMDQMLTITIGGKHQKVPLRKAMLLRLAENFMQRGDLKSLAFLFQLYEAAVAAKKPHEAVGAEDEAILEMLKKMLQGKKDGDDNV